MRPFPIIIVDLTVLSLWWAEQVTAMPIRTKSGLQSKPHGSNYVLFTVVFFIT